MTNTAAIRAYIAVLEELHSATRPIIPGPFVREDAARRFRLARDSVILVQGMYTNELAPYSKAVKALLKETEKP